MSSGLLRVTLMVNEGLLGDFKPLLMQKKNMEEDLLGSRYVSISYLVYLTNLCTNGMVNLVQLLPHICQDRSNHVLLLIHVI